MFEFGFTRADLVRAVWAFVAIFAATFVALMVGPLQALQESCAAETGCDWSTAKGAAMAAGVAAIGTAALAVKNLVLKDGSKVKG